MEYDAPAGEAHRARPARLRHTVVTALVAILAGAGVCDAIVIRHDRHDEAYRELARGYPWCSLQLGGWGGGCTLVDPRWVVTAAHAVGRLSKQGAEIQVGDELVAVDAVIRHPEFDETTYRNDIALVRLARPVTAVAPVALSRERNEEGRRVVFVGQGFSGTGETGAQRSPAARRAAENRVESVSEQWLRFVFDAPPGGLELEGISGPGDSGGPAYLDTAEGPRLVGISSWQDNRKQGAEGLYGVLEYYTRVSSYVDWIEAETRRGR
jgi:hypothetical protein